MIPNQLLRRLPILLAQKQSGSDSQKLNNEIRQIVYKLYQSKNMTRTVCNHLMNSVLYNLNSKIFIKDEHYFYEH